MEQPAAAGTAGGAPGPSTSTAGNTSASASQNTTTDIISPLNQDVTECLCDFVVARKSTEQLRNLATWLLILISRANGATKEVMFRLLSRATTELAQTIATQLSAVINEVNSLSPSKRRPSTSSGPSIPHSVSMTRLPDRFGDSGASVIIGGGSMAPPPVQTGGELELATLQPLVTSRSEQSRFCRILRLMIHLTNSPETSMQPIEGLAQVWERLSGTLECLQEMGDMNSALLLQPLVEALCLTHATSSPTALVVRQSLSLSRRMSRLPLGGSGANALSSTIHELIFNSEPSLDLFAPAMTTTPAASLEPIPPLSPESQIDLNRPMSPPVASGEATTSEKSTSEGPSTSTAGSASTGAAATSPGPLAGFADKHRASLNHILRNYSGNLSDSAFTVLLAHPKALDFDVKRRFFRQRFQTINHRYGILRHDDEPVVVSRDRIFEDSYARLHRKSPKEWKRKFVIRFQSEF